VAATPPQSFIVHNANFPAGCAADAPVHRTVPARVIVPGLFSPAADDGTHRFIFKYGHNVSPVAPLTDCDTIERGLISHTVLDYTKLGGF
jgi:5'-nucleotidase